MKLPDKKIIGGFVLGFICFPAVFFVMTIIFAKVFMTGSEKLPPPELPDEQAISLDWNVTTLDGQLLNLGQASSGRPVFVNFWATWCPSCVKEMPNIEKLYDTFKDRVVFACISTEDPKTLKDFSTTRGVHIPLYKMYGNRPPGLETPGVPATFILSPEGKILVKHIGSADWSHEKVVNYLTKIIDEKNIKK